MQWSDKKEKQNWIKRNNLNRSVSPSLSLGCHFVLFRLHIFGSSICQKCIFFLLFVSNYLGFKILAYVSKYWIFCPWTKPSYRDKSLEKRLVISENSSSGGGRSLTAVAKSSSLSHRRPFGLLGLVSRMPSLCLVWCWMKWYSLSSHRLRLLAL